MVTCLTHAGLKLDPLPSQNNLCLNKFTSPSDLDEYNSDRQSDCDKQCRNSGRFIVDKDNPTTGCSGIYSLVGTSESAVQGISADNLTMFRVCAKWNIAEPYSPYLSRLDFVYFPAPRAPSAPKAELVECQTL